ncbi:hypothetical protein, partial [Stenotrophomonas rhizophila]
KGMGASPPPTDRRAEKTQYAPLHRLWEKKQKNAGQCPAFFQFVPTNDIRAVLALTLRAGALHR